MAKNHLVQWLASWACLFALTGCHQTTNRWAVTDVSVSMPDITGHERPVRRAGNPTEFLDVNEGGNQTILVLCTRHDNPKRANREWSRAHVIVLDGPPAAGTYQVSPANGRLIENSSWRPARQPYSGLEGSITIKSIKDNKVITDCSIRNIIARTEDPVYPLRGRYEFDLVPAKNVPLDESAIHIGK
jgi:hypothetical protein